MRMKLIGCVVAAASGLAACSDRGDAPPPATTTTSDRTAAATPTTVPTPTPDEAAGSVSKWVIEEPVEIGPGPGQLDVALYIEQGCTQCDGPPATLERIWRDENGTLQRRVLFSTPTGSTYMTSTAVAGDWTLYTTACFGECAEVGSYVNNGYTLIYTSTDDGETWEASEPSQSARRFLDGTMPDGQVVLMERAAYASGATAPPPTFRAFPSGVELFPPAPDTWPQVTADPEHPVVWAEYETGKVFLTGGAEVPIPPLGTPDSSGTPRIFGTQPPSGLGLLWLDTRGGRRDWHYSVVEDGRLARDLVGDDTAGAPWVQIWLDADRAFGRLNYSQAALFDFASATVTPIRIYEALPGDPFIGRNKIVGYRPLSRR